MIIQLPLDVLVAIIFRFCFGLHELTPIKPVGLQHESCLQSNKIESDRSIFFGDMYMLTITVDLLANILIDHTFCDELAHHCFTFFLLC